jgi:chaperonin GroEL
MHAKSLVIVARGFEGAARATLSANRSALRMHVLGFVPAEVGIDAMHVLDDLCVATGATVISEETGTSMSNVRPSMLGHASKVTVEHGRAVFAGASGAADSVEKRRVLLDAQAATTRYLALDREKLERRAARLAGDWGVLRIGGHTQWEAEQHVEGARAALAALGAASASGVVDGGGRAFTGIAHSLAALRKPGMCEIRRAAIDCIVAGCRIVPAQLAANAGIAQGEDCSDSSPSVEQYRTFDPSSTTLAILQHAVSIAATLLTVEVLIC